jgi:hypothetical protein
MVQIWAGDTDIRSARKEGRLELQGHPDLVRTISSWLRGGLYAKVRPHPDAKALPLQHSSHDFAKG